MSNSTTDFYHQKTDAELQFFLDNPGYYQPELVAEARRELRRRGALQSPPAAPAPAYHPAPEAAPGLKAGPVVLGVAVVLALSLGGFYYVQQKNNPAAAIEAAPVRKSPPRLIEVPTSVIPSYDVEGLVNQQLGHVPAAERASAARAEQPLRQYRELTRRFWTAQTQTEFVLKQARAGQFTEALPGHIESVGTAWQQWNKATVYSYKFGPAMADHLDIMTRVARQQQEALSDLLIVANNPQQYENAETRRRDDDVSELLSGLLPKSPVTGQPYNAKVRKVHL